MGEARLFKDDRTLKHPWHPGLDTERLFERGTDPKVFVMLGDWDHLAHEIGRRFIPPMDEYITGRTGRIYPYHIPRGLYPDHGKR